LAVEEVVLFAAKAFFKAGNTVKRVFCGAFGGDSPKIVVFEATAVGILNCLPLDGVGCRNFLVLFVENGSAMTVDGSIAIKEHHGGSNNFVVVVGVVDGDVIWGKGVKFCLQVFKGEWCEMVADRSDFE